MQNEFKIPHTQIVRFIFLSFLFYLLFLFSTLDDSNNNNALKWNVGWIQFLFRFWFSIRFGIWFCGQKEIENLVKL